MARRSRPADGFEIPGLDSARPGASPPTLALTDSTVCAGSSHCWGHRGGGAIGPSPCGGLRAAVFFGGRNRARRAVGPPGRRRSYALFLWTTPELLRSNLIPDGDLRSRSALLEKSANPSSARKSRIKKIKMMVVYNQSATLINAVKPELTAIRLIKSRFTVALRRVSR